MFLWLLPRNCQPVRKIAENIGKQLRTSQNSWEHRKTSKIIWYHPKNNWGLIIDDLVQFEEDLNSRTEVWKGWGGDRLCQTRPDPETISWGWGCLAYILIISGPALISLKWFSLSCVPRRRYCQMRGAVLESQEMCTWICIILNIRYC